MGVLQPDLAVAARGRRHSAFEAAAPGGPSAPGVVARMDGAARAVIGRARVGARQIVSPRERTGRPFSTKARVRRIRGSPFHSRSRMSRRAPLCRAKYPSWTPRIVASVCGTMGSRSARGQVPGYAQRIRVRVEHGARTRATTSPDATARRLLVAPCRLVRLALLSVMAASASAFRARSCTVLTSGTARSSGVMSARRLRRGLSPLAFATRRAPFHIRRCIQCVLLMSASPCVEGSRGCRWRAASYDRPVSESPYRVPVPRPPDPYIVAWANLGRRKAFAWAAALLWALAFTVTLPAIVARARVVGIAAAVTAVCWVSRIVGNIVLAHFRCPRCGSSFYGARRTWVPWSSACVTCGIEIGTPKYPHVGDVHR